MSAAYVGAQLGATEDFHPGTPNHFAAAFEKTILGGVHRAILWIGGGTEDSWIDLSAHLPAECEGFISDAYAVVRDENGTHVVGCAERAGMTDVIVWALH